MKKRFFLLSIAILVISIFLAFFLIKSKETIIQNSPIDESLCKIEKYSDKAKINVLFYSTKEKAQIYSNYLLEIEPFRRYKDKFNFYYIDDYELNCTIYDEKATFCYSKKIIKDSSKCKPDYIVAITTMPAEIRSSTYMNFISINSAHPLSVFAHEFGHAFANLADEYVPSKLPEKQENCKKSCEKFPNNSCFAGCSENEYYRSIENGIMKTLSSKEYGKYNEGIIEKKIIELEKKPLLTGRAVSNNEKPCLSNLYYLIEAWYENTNISIISQTIQEGCAYSVNQGSFEYVILDDKKNRLYGDFFSPEIIFSDDEKGGGALEYKGLFYLKVPFINQSETIEIYKDSQLKAKLKLNKEFNTPCKA